MSDPIEQVLGHDVDRARVRSGRAGLASQAVQLRVAQQPLGADHEGSRGRLSGEPEAEDQHALERTDHPTAAEPLLGVGEPRPHRGQHQTDDRVARGEEHHEHAEDEQDPLGR